MRKYRSGVARLALAVATLSVLSGCIRVAAPTSSPAPAPNTSAAAPSVAPPPTAAAPQPAAEELQNDIVANLVEDNGQTACDLLKLKPTTDVNELVDLILSTYGVESMEADSQRAIASQFLGESAAAYCPEQGERIGTDLNSD